MNDRGWTQRDIARKIDVPESTVSRWLTGSTPQDKHLPGVATVTGLPLDELVTHCAQLRSETRIARRPPTRRTKSRSERLEDLEATVAALQAMIERRDEDIAMIKAAVIHKAVKDTAKKPARSRRSA